jgi:hypothetical protein
MGTSILDRPGASWEYIVVASIKIAISALYGNVPL